MFLVTNTRGQSFDFEFFLHKIDADESANPTLDMYPADEEAELRVNRAERLLLQARMLVLERQLQTLEEREIELMEQYQPSPSVLTSQTVPTQEPVIAKGEGRGSNEGSEASEDDVDDALRGTSVPPPPAAGSGDEESSEESSDAVKASKVGPAGDDEEESSSDDDLTTLISKGTQLTKRKPVSSNSKPKWRCDTEPPRSCRTRLPRRLLRGVDLEPCHRVRPPRRYGSVLYHHPRSCTKCITTVVVSRMDSSCVFGLRTREVTEVRRRRLGRSRKEGLSKSS